jgi:L-malate glycosyltransferase
VMSSLSTVQVQQTALEHRDATPILLMTNTLETGGSERQFVSMAKALNCEGFSVHSACLRRIGPFVDQVDGLHEFSPGGSLFGMQSWRARWNLARHLKAHKIQVVHSFDFYSNLMLIPAARLAGVPAVIGSHRQLGDLLTANQFRVQSAAFALCDRVVCNSRAAADRLQQVGIRPTKLAVIPNGLAEAMFASVDPALPPSANILRIGMISRMNDPVKRYDMFLRVASRLAPRFPQVQFVLVGDGPLRPRLEQMARELSLSDRISFLGDRGDIPAVLAALDISVLPSASESLSNVILESMAAGVAVVASEVGGSPELVENGKTGWLFPRDNEDRFAAALETLVTQPELCRQMGTNARERARSRYSISTVRQQYQHLYRQVLDEKSESVPLGVSVDGFKSTQSESHR